MIKDTTDVWLTAFLVKKKYEIKRYDVIGRGKIKCYFEISDEDWKTLKLEFSKSELAEFKQIIDGLKDLAW